jgi:hypothetical protein
MRKLGTGLELEGPRCLVAGKKCFPSTSSKKRGMAACDYGRSKPMPVPMLKG